MMLILTIILGLVVGSFLNAVIYRLHVEVSFLKGRSYCPFCKHDLNFLDLVPLLSFIVLRGKCRYCHKPISWQYPLVEAATTLAFVLVYFAFGLSAAFYVYLLFAAILILIFVYDLRYYLILDKVTLPAIVVCFLLSWLVLKNDVIQLLLGALVGGGFFLLQYVVSKGKWIGGGDFRLGALMGVMLGLQPLLVALFIAYLLGSLIGLCLVFFGKKKLKSQVPFGTFLSGATFITFLISDQIISYYRNLFLL